MLVDATLGQVPPLAVRTERTHVHHVSHRDPRVDLEDRLGAPAQQPDDLDVIAVDEMVGQVDHGTGHTVATVGSRQQERPAAGRVLGGGRGARSGELLGRTPSAASPA